MGGIIELVKPSSLQPQEIRLVLSPFSLILSPPFFSPFLSISLSQETIFQQIAGAIIRVVGNRFAWHVKEAMLETLVIMLNRVGDVVKTFLPMLQPLFQKGLVF